VGDCYFLAALSSLAQSDPNIIRQMIAPLGDGSYAVRFWQNGQATYLRVDAQLPVFTGDVLKYAKLTPDGELWVALTEKAYAQFRTGQNSYSSISSGWMGTVYSQITNVAPSGASPGSLSMAGDALGQYLYDNLQVGHAVSAGSLSAPAGPIVGSHAYTVQSAQNVGGAWYVTVFNVWGCDGKVWDSNPSDGLLTLTLDVFRQNFIQVSVSMA
jgi:hypothetical protein